MHIPKFFEVTDAGIIEKFIKETSLATLVTRGSDFPVGTHIPLEMEINDKGEKVLWGHISKANPQWQDFLRDENVLAIFLSPVNHYISSSWYNHPNAPTWKSNPDTAKLGSAGFNASPILTITIFFPGPI